MKIIDFVHYGNTFRLYLGEDDCEDYWGDDWNDAPYEHNAGQVYQEYIQGYVEFAFPLKYSVCEACNGYLNSPFSKEDMINRKVPCLTISTEPEIKIYFGDNIDEISKQITELGGLVIDTHPIQRKFNGCRRGECKACVDKDTCKFSGVEGDSE